VAALHGDPAAPWQPGLDEFRFEFRVRWPMFNWQLGRARASGVFPNDQERRRGRQLAPLGLKVAASLRYLALGVTANGLEEGSGLSPGTMEELSFGTGRTQSGGVGGCFLGLSGSSPVYGFVHPLQWSWTDQTFAWCGFPEAVSSQDGVHTAWDNTPSQDR